MPSDRFPVRKSSNDGLGPHCKKCCVKRNAAFRMRALGSVGKLECVKCGNSEFEFLTLQHKNGGGRKHRASAANWKSVLSEASTDPDRESAYEVMCASCNMEDSVLRHEALRSGTEKSVRRRLADATVKAAALSLLNGGSPSCSCCGESDVRKLCVDHVVPYAASRTGPRGGVRLYRWILTRGAGSLSNLQSLCANCNQSKGSGSSCVHVRSTRLLS